MKIKQLILAGGAIVALLSFNACNQGGEDALYQRWQATNMESTMADSMKAEQEKFIDTLSMVPEEFASYFESDNLDEIKAELRAQLKADEEIMELTSDLLSLEFLKDNTVIFHSHPENDTANFKLENNGKEIVISNKETNDSEVFVIKSISKNSLVLTQTQDGNTATITFRNFEDSKDKDRAEKAFETINEKMMGAMGGGGMDHGHMEMSDEEMEELLKQLQQEQE